MSLLIRRSLLVVFLASCGPAVEISGDLLVGADAGAGSHDRGDGGVLQHRTYDGGTPSDCPSPNLSSIRSLVFVPKCGGPECHSSDRPAQSLDLSLGVPALSARLAEVSKESLAGLSLVKPNQYGASWLYLKVFLATPTAGAQMPSSAPLDPCTLDSIKDWIQSGAPAD